MDSRLCGNDKRMKKKKIVTIGGGSGQYVLLAGLRDLKGIEITSVVSMVDSGGSTGRLRDEFGVLPPGDALKCILALTPGREFARKLLLTKFKKDNRLNGHNAGNLLITMLTQYTGNFPLAIEALGEILNIRGKVLPVTTDKATLVAELTDGELVYGETAIDIPVNSKRKKIKKTFLVPHHTNDMKAYPEVIEALYAADYIVVGPGDLYSSITPNFLVPGVTEVLKKSKAKLVFIVNVMTKFGESDNFSVNDFVKRVEAVVGRPLDHILVNNGEVDRVTIKRYKEQKASLVRINKKLLAGRRNYIIEDFLSEIGEVVRHDSEKLSHALVRLINK
jgi:uncharacterized cofD-like protein